MPTSSIYHDMVIDNEESAKILLDVLERGEQQASLNQCITRDIKTQLDITHPNNR